MSLSRRTLFRLGGVATAGTALAGCDTLIETVFPGLQAPASLTGPFRVPQSDRVGRLRHVMERLSFGLRPEDWHRALDTGGGDEDTAIERFIDQQLHPERIDDRRADHTVRRLETIRLPQRELFEYQPRLLLAELTRHALLRAIHSQRQLHEVMVGFWTDHFNIDISKGDCEHLLPAHDRDVIRRHALGRFPELLRAVALSPAMLWYLDGRVNRRRHYGDQPNENYARELLELHTLGVDGGYSQRDVMETARALTGWHVRSEERFAKGKIEFDIEAHDRGPKEVLGHRLAPGRGEQDTHDVLRIAAHHPATARHLASKLCRRFIDDDPDPTAIAVTARAFEESRGDIRRTLATLFSTDAFLRARGTQLKRPFHFVVSALRAIAADTDAGEAMQRYLLSMGQAPFQYPTPDGYPLEPAPWRGTLLWRWNLASALVDGRIDGTRVDRRRLEDDLVGPSGVAAHLLGRRPSEAEQVAAHHAADPLALLLASPAFQRF
ncbi:MAG: DUF1800 domain-containing protein [Acidobacteriota bacterium]